MKLSEASTMEFARAAETPTLSLVVIQTSDLERSKAFYEAMGHIFVEERHGHGPSHFAADLNGVVFEIYPLNDSQRLSPKLRIGFRVHDTDQIFERLVKLGADVISSPRDSAWGRRAVLRDPDGYTVELVSED